MLFRRQALLSGIIFDKHIENDVNPGVNNSNISGRLEKIPPRKARPPLSLLKGGGFCASEHAPLCLYPEGEKETG